MSKSVVLRSAQTLDLDIKGLPHQPGIYIVKVGGNGWTPGAVIYVGKAEASIRARWRQRLENWQEGEGSDAVMMSEVVKLLARRTRITIEARPVTLAQFGGKRDKMVKRIRHDEGVLIRHFQKPRLNKRLEDHAIDPWLRKVDAFWATVDRGLALFGIGFCLALMFKVLLS